MEGLNSNELWYRVGGEVPPWWMDEGREWAMIYHHPILPLLFRLRETILGFDSCVETAMLVYKTMEKCRSSFA